jgi:hypothetical protein
MMGIGGLSSEFFLGLVEESFEVFFIHEVFGELLGSDGFVGYDEIGREFGGVVFPVGVIIDGTEGVREVGSDQQVVLFLFVYFGVFVFHNDYFIYN